ncbi:MAG: hypothetical protein ACXAE3_09230 [Candidatus Kariarchaeaceae archaeon]
MATATQTSNIFSTLFNIFSRSKVSSASIVKEELAINQPPMESDGAKIDLELAKGNAYVRNYTHKFY